MKVFELNVEIYTSNFREKVLVEAKNEVEAITMLRTNFYDYWCEHFSNYVFYEYKLGEAQEVKDIRDSRYNDSVIFSKDGGVEYLGDDSSNMRGYYQRYGYDENQLSLFN